MLSNFRVQDLDVRTSFLALAIGAALIVVAAVGCSDRDSVVDPVEEDPETATLSLTLDLETAGAPLPDSEGAQTLEAKIQIAEILNTGTEILLETEIRQFDESQSSPTFQIETASAELVRVTVDVTGARTRNGLSTGVGLLHSASSTVTGLMDGTTTSHSMTLPELVPTISVIETPPTGYRLQWSSVETATTYRIQKVEGSTTEEFVSAGLDTLIQFPPGLTAPLLSYRVSADLDDGRTSAYSETSGFDEPGSIAPAAVADLAIVQSDHRQAMLSWTAPGDDGDEGQAASYDLRVSTTPITDQNFGVASPVASVGDPNFSGRTEYAVAEGLAANTTYYFALKTFDELPNISGLSNVATVTTSNPPDDEAPATITGFTATNIDESTVRLTWTAPADGGGSGQAEAYELRYRTKPIDESNFVSGVEVSSVPSPGSPGTSESADVTGLEPGEYHFAIRSRDGAGNVSTISAPVTLVTLDQTAPDDVEDLEAEVSDGEATLSWTASGDNQRDGRAASYDIRYSTSPIDEGNFEDATPIDSPPSPHDAGAAESMAIPGLRAETTYYFALRVLDEAGNVSPISNRAQITTSDFEAPADVADLRSEEVTGVRALLFWTAPGDNTNDGTASRYDLRFSLDPIDEDNFEDADEVGGIDQIDPAKAGVPESVELTANQDVQVYLALRTRDEVPNTSGMSNVVFVHFGDDAPNGPTDLEAVPVSSSAIQLSFTDNSPDEEFFEVERKREGSAVFERIGVIDGSGLFTATGSDASASFRPTRRAGGKSSTGGPLEVRIGRPPIADEELSGSDRRDVHLGNGLSLGGDTINATNTGLSERTVYTYRVRAFNGGGPSAYSNESAAETEIGPPTDLVVQTVSESALEVSWSMGSDTDQFQIERAIGSSDFEPLVEVAGDERSYLDSGLTSETTYSYRVLGVDGDDLSEWSTTATGSTSANPPICVLNQTSLDFGVVPIGEATVDIVRLENAGAGRLVGSVTHDCTHFAAGDQPYDLGPGESALIQIGFRPLAAGEQACEVFLGPACESVVVQGTGDQSSACSLQYDTLNFGELSLGDTRVEKFFLSNTGGGFIQGTVSLDGSDDFELIDGAGSYTLGAGETRRIEVAFRPSSDGSQECALLVDAEGCPDLILSGAGVGFPTCEYLETPIDFGAIAVGESSVKRLIFTNEGSGRLQGTLQTNCGDVFRIVGGAEFDVGPGQAHSALLSFSPENAGNQICSIDGGAICGPLLATGEGVAEDLCELSSTTIDWGTVEVDFPARSGVQVVNRGAAPIEIDPQLSPRCSPDNFTLLSEGPFTIQPGEKEQIGVLFTPTTAGQDYSCTLYLGNESCPSVQLSGRGEPLDCAIEPSGDFGTMIVGETYGRTFTITNNSDETISGVIEDNCVDAVVRIANGGGAYSLAPNERHAFTVAFVPVVGNYQCKVIFGQFGETPCTTLPIKGIGELPAPACEIEGDSSFEAILGQTVEHQYIVTNNGNVDLELFMALGDDSSCDAFELIGGGAHTITPGDYRKFTIRYTPLVNTFSVCRLKFGNGTCGFLDVTGVVLP